MVSQQLCEIISVGKGHLQIKCGGHYLVGRKWRQPGGGNILLCGNTVAPLDRVPVFIVSSVMNIQLWALS